MKKFLYLMLSLLGFGSSGCCPPEQEEVAMYAAPYAEYNPSINADVDMQEGEVDDAAPAIEEE